MGGFAFNARQMGVPSGGAAVRPAAVGNAFNKAMSGTSSVPGTTETQQPARPNPRTATPGGQQQGAGGAQDYSGGNPFLTGLNYSPPPPSGTQVQTGQQNTGQQPRSYPGGPATGAPTIPTGPQYYGEPYFGPVTNFGGRYLPDGSVEWFGPTQGTQGNFQPTQNQGWMWNAPAGQQTQAPTIPGQGGAPTYGQQAPGTPTGGGAGNQPANVAPTLPQPTPQITAGSTPSGRTYLTGGTIDPGGDTGGVGAGVPGGAGVPQPPTQPRQDIPAPTTNVGGPANSYAGGFQNYMPPFTFQPPDTLFSRNAGPSPATEGRPPDGYGVVPPFSPALSMNYFNWLFNQAGNLAQGVGATPYGQQQTFLPGWGQSGMMGLTAPENPFSQWGRQGIQGAVQNYADMLGGLNPATMQQQYNPYLDAANTFAGQGALGAPGQQLGLRSQFGATGNTADPLGMFTGAQALQGAASGVGTPGLPGQYLNSAIQYGGMGLPAQLQSQLGQYGALPGAGGSTLSNMAQYGGTPIDQMPAWNAMIEAQQRNIDRNAAQIAERMAQTGNLMGGSGTPYNTALTDYFSQTSRDQNALLADMTRQALESGAGRQYGAASTLFGGQQNALADLANRQQQAGLFGGSQQQNAAQQLQNYMMGANQLMNQNQQFGLGTGLGALQNQQQIPYNILGQQYGNLANMLGGVNNLANIYQQRDQDAINRQYQEFLRTRPEYSPLLGQLFSGATTFPGVISTNMPGSGLGSVIGSALGGLPWNRIFGGTPGGGAGTGSGNTGGNTV